MTAAIEVEHVWKTFRVFSDKNTTLKQAVLRRNRQDFEQFWALQDVTFQIPQGSTFGIVGSNGAGKSTMLKTLSRILVPDRGRVRVNGKVSALLELGAGFHPELSGRENVYLNGNILGLSNRDIDRRFDEIVEFAGLGAFIEQPVKTYSSGMYARLGFSVAIAVEPDILLIDEVLSVGDEEFQRRSTERMEEIRSSGKTVVFVSHGLTQVRKMCDQAVWLDHGEVKASGATADVVDSYLASIEAGFRLDEHGRQRTGSGEVTIDVEVVATHGGPVVTGDDVILRVHWVADQQIDDLVIGLGIRDPEGVLVGGTSTAPVGGLSLGPGAGTLCYQIERLALLPGSYHIAAAVTHAETQHVYDHSPHMVAFEVEPSERVRAESGYTALGGSWSTKDVR